MRNLCLAIVGLVLTVPAAHGQSGLGDVKRGYDFAKRICAECHRIEKGQKGLKVSAIRSFQEIADNPARTALYLRVFLRTPHRDMPNYILAEEETDNIIAYIHSLK